MVNYKQNTTYTFYWIILFWLYQQPQAISGKYPLQNFTPSDYKAGIQNIDFAQNRNMAIFVANNLGVLAYNGINWDLHALKTGKKHRCLAFDEHTNRLYSGSQGAFGYFDENWNYVSLANKVPDSSPDFDEVWDVFLFNSNVYFCTFQGIFVYDGQDISVIREKEGLYRSFQAGNKLFTQSRTGKLYEIKDDKLVAVAASQAHRNETIAGIIPRKMAT